MDLWEGEGLQGRGMDWKFGISKCKPLYIGWISNRILLYDTGNYIQHPVINHIGKEYTICITESIHCVAELNIIKEP